MTLPPGDVQQGTWRRAVPRMLSTLVAGLLIFRFGFRLSWSATIALLVVVVGGGTLYWRAFRYKLPPNSRRARLLIRTGRAKLRAACTECGWRGEISSLTRRSDEGRVVYLCPTCGHEVGHSV
jgi:DNA-directed RNA polymerase subunit RPC12/RpoP